VPYINLTVPVPLVAVALIAVVLVVATVRWLFP